MKTLIIITILFPAVSFAWKGTNSDRFMLNYLQWGAQFELGYEQMQEIYYGTKANAPLINKVKTVTFYTVSKSGKERFSSERTFDSNGRLIRKKSKNNTVDFKFTDTLLTEIIRSTGKHHFNTRILYDAQARIVKIVVFEDDKLAKETNYTYFTDQKTSLVEKKIYGRKTRTYRLETDFDPLLKTATESRYTINGKLIKHWTYSCDQKGKLEQKKVEEVTQCQYYSSNNDGSYISYTRTIRDGNDVLNESHFSKDSVLVEYNIFLHDSILISRYRNFNNTIVSEGFNKDGKRFYKSVIEKDDRGNTLKNSFYGKKDKSPFVYAYSYFKNDLIQEVQFANGRKLKFEYTYL